MSYQEIAEDMRRQGRRHDEPVEPTPGPWETSLRNGPGYECHIWVQQERSPATGLKPLARVHGDVHCSEVQSNVAVIAGAADMFEALERIGDDAIRALASGEVTNDVLRRICTDARRAVAQVKGYRQAVKQQVIAEYGEEDA